MARATYDAAMSDESTKPAYERIEGVQVGQYVSYRFFKVDPAWRRLPVEEREAAKDAFAAVVEDWSERMEGLRAYNVSGIRPGRRLLPLADHRVATTTCSSSARR